MRLKPIHITAIFGLVWLVVLYAALLPSGNCWFFSQQLGEQSTAELVSLIFYFYSAIMFTLLYRQTHLRSYVGFFAVAVFFFLEESNYLTGLKLVPDQRVKEPFSLQRPLVEVLESLGVEYYVLSSLVSLAIAVWLYFMLMNAPSRQKLRRDMYIIALAPTVITVVTVFFYAVAGGGPGIDAAVCGWEKHQEVVKTVLASCFAYYSTIRWYSIESGNGSVASVREGDVADNDEGEDEEDPLDIEENRRDS